MTADLLRENARLVMGVVGYIVMADAAPELKTPKYKAVSRIFTMKSAAEEFRDRLLAIDASSKAFVREVQKLVDP